VGTGGRARGTGSKKEVQAAPIRTQMTQNTGAKRKQHGVKQRKTRKEKKPCGGGKKRVRYQSVPTRKTKTTSTHKAPRKNPWKSKSSAHDRLIIKKEGRKNE